MYSHEDTMKDILSKLPLKTRRALIGFVGWAVLLLGVVMIPYPGPGWVVVFIGLSILASEFDWAKAFHDKLRSKYDAWSDWLKAQPMYIKAIFWILTAVTVIVTVWLLNGYGLIDSWFHLHQHWLNSPFVR